MCIFMLPTRLSEEKFSNFQHDAFPCWGDASARTWVLIHGRRVAYSKKCKDGNTGAWECGYRLLGRVTEHMYVQRSAYKTQRQWQAHKGGARIGSWSYFWPPGNFLKIVVKQFKRVALKFSANSSNHWKSIGIIFLEPHSLVDTIQYNTQIYECAVESMVNSLLNALCRVRCHHKQSAVIACSYVDTAGLCKHSMQRRITFFGL